MTKTTPAANIVLAKCGLNGFVSTEVKNSTFVLRMSVSAKNPAHREYATHYEYNVVVAVLNVKTARHNTLMNL